MLWSAHDGPTGGKKMEMEASQGLASATKKYMCSQYLEILQLAEQIVIRGKPYRKSMTDVLGLQCSDPGEEQSSVNWAREPGLPRRVFE
jgi:hypothetical protein